MSEHLFLSQDPVKGRLRGQVLAPVRKPRNNLLRRKITELLAVGRLQDLLSFSLAETMRRRFERTSTEVFSPLLLSPPDDGPGAQAEDLRGRPQSGSGGNGLVNELQHYFPFFRGVSSSSSPQIDWAFFLSTSRAAASARALSLRANSRFSSLTSLVGAFFFAIFFREALP